MILVTKTRTNSNLNDHGKRLDLLRSEHQRYVREQTPSLVADLTRILIIIFVLIRIGRVIHDFWLWDTGIVNHIFHSRPAR